jgi:hypothetical protein
MRGSLRAHRVAVDHRQQLHLPQPLSALMVDAQHVMHVEVFTAAHTPMLKSFAPKAYQSRSTKFASYSHAFHGRHQWADGA